MFIPSAKFKIFRSLVVWLVVVTFTTTFFTPVPRASAQTFPLLNLPLPGTMVNLSPAFTPVLLRGLKVYPQEPLKFDFIVDTGNSGLKEKALEEESSKIIKYFLASLTVPEDDLWVNLSPYEKERIIPESFGQTEMGRDMLAQDYVLKQLTASLMYPEKELGKNFWERVYKQAREKFGTTEIPMDTFNKVWIVPEKAVVYENGETVFVTEARLKVMLEEDYEAMQRMGGKVVSAKGRPASGGSDKSGIKTPEDTDISTPTTTSSTFSAPTTYHSGASATLTTQVIKDILLPEIEREVNEGENFAQLRQIYHSLILAAWFKRALKENILNKVYVDQNKIAGVDVTDKNIKDKIYAQYLEAFKKGVYDYIKEDYDPVAQEIIPRKYFSGGFSLQGIKYKLERHRIPTSPGASRGFIGKIMPGIVGAMMLVGINLVQPESVRAQEVSMTSSKMETQPANNSLISEIEPIAVKIIAKYPQLLSDFAPVDHSLQEVVKRWPPDQVRSYLALADSTLGEKIYNTLIEDWGLTGPSKIDFLEFMKIFADEDLINFILNKENAYAFHQFTQAYQAEFSFYSIRDDASKIIQRLAQHPFIVDPEFVARVRQYNPVETNFIDDKLQLYYVDNRGFWEFWDYLQDPSWLASLERAHNLINNFCDQRSIKMGKAARNWLAYVIRHRPEPFMTALAIFEDHGIKLRSQAQLIASFETVFSDEKQMSYLEDPDFWQFYSEINTIFNADPQIAKASPFYVFNLLATARELYKIVSTDPSKRELLFSDRFKNMFERLKSLFPRETSAFSGPEQIFPFSSQSLIAFLDAAEFLLPEASRGNSERQVELQRWRDLETLVDELNRNSPGQVWDMDLPLLIEILRNPVVSDFGHLQDFALDRDFLLKYIREQIYTARPYFRDVTEVDITDHLAMNERPEETVLERMSTLFLLRVVLIHHLQGNYQEQLSGLMFEDWTEERKGRLLYSLGQASELGGTLIFKDGHINIQEIPSATSYNNGYDPIIGEYGIGGIGAFHTHFTRKEEFQNYFTRLEENPHEIPEPITGSAGPSYGTDTSPQLAGLGRVGLVFAPVEVTNDSLSVDIDIFTDGVVIDLGAVKVPFTMPALPKTEVVSDQMPTPDPAALGGGSQETQATSRSAPAAQGDPAAVGTTDHAMLADVVKKFISKKGLMLSLSAILVLSSAGWQIFQPQDVYIEVNEKKEEIYKITSLWDIGNISPLVNMGNRKALLTFAHILDGNQNYPLEWRVAAARYLRNITYQVQQGKVDQDVIQRFQQSFKRLFHRYRDDPEALPLLTQILSVFYLSDSIPGPSQEIKNILLDMAGKHYPEVQYQIFISKLVRLFIDKTDMKLSPEAVILLERLAIEDRFNVKDEGYMIAATLTEKIIDLLSRGERNHYQSIRDRYTSVENLETLSPGEIKFFSRFMTTGLDVREEPQGTQEIFLFFARLFEGHEFTDEETLLLSLNVLNRSGQYIIYGSQKEPSNHDYQPAGFSRDEFLRHTHDVLRRAHERHWKKITEILDDRQGKYEEEIAGLARKTALDHFEQEVFTTYFDPQRLEKGWIPDPQEISFLALFADYPEDGLSKDQKLFLREFMFWVLLNFTSDNYNDGFDDVLKSAINGPSMGHPLITPQEQYDRLPASTVALIESVALNREGRFINGQGSAIGILVQNDQERVVEKYLGGELLRVDLTEGEISFYLMLIANIHAQYDFGRNLPETLKEKIIRFSSKWLSILSLQQYETIFRILNQISSIQVDWLQSLQGGIERPMTDAVVDLPDSLSSENFKSYAILNIVYKRYQGLFQREMPAIQTRLGRIGNEIKSLDEKFWTGLSLESLEEFPVVIYFIENFGVPEQVKEYFYEKLYSFFRDTLQANQLEPVEQLRTKFNVLDPALGDNVLVHLMAFHIDTTLNLETMEPEGVGPAIEQGILYFEGKGIEDHDVRNLYQLIGNFILSRVSDFISRNSETVEEHYGRTYSDMEQRLADLGVPIVKPDSYIAKIVQNLRAGRLSYLWQKGVSKIQELSPEGENEEIDLNTKDYSIAPSQAYRLEEGAEIMELKKEGYEGVYAHIVKVDPKRGGRFELSGDIGRVRGGISGESLQDELDSAQDEDGVKRRLILDFPVSFTTGDAKPTEIFVEDGEIKNFLITPHGKDGLIIVDKNRIPHIADKRDLWIHDINPSVSPSEDRRLELTQKLEDYLTFIKLVREEKVSIVSNMLLYDGETMFILKDDDELAQRRLILEFEDGTYGLINPVPLMQTSEATKLSIAAGLITGNPVVKIVYLDTGQFDYTTFRPKDGEAVVWGHSDQKESSNRIGIYVEEAKSAADPAALGGTQQTQSPDRVAQAGDPAAVGEKVRENFKRLFLDKVGSGIMGILLGLSIRGLATEDLYGHYDDEYDVIVVQDEVINIIGRAAGQPQGFAFNFEGIVVVPESILHRAKEDDKEALMFIAHEKRHNDYRELQGETSTFSVDQKLIDELYAHFASFVDIYGTAALDEIRETEHAKGKYGEIVSFVLIRDYIDGVYKNLINDTERDSLKIMTAVASFIIYNLIKTYGLDFTLEYLKKNKDLKAIASIAGKYDQLLSFIQHYRQVFALGDSPAILEAEYSRWLQQFRDFKKEHLSGISPVDRAAQVSPAGDAAAIGEAPGGIDVTRMDQILETHGQAVPIQFPALTPQNLEQIPFNGLTPVIINITPIQNLAPWLGVKTEESEDNNLSLAR